jgi:hypothetical protein
MVEMKKPRPFFPKTKGRDFLAHIFFHPDYTVGSGIAPDQPLYGSWAMTTGGDLHPALKTFYSNVQTHCILASYF